MTLLGVVMIAMMAIIVGADPKVHYDLSQARPLFEKFMKDYNRHYKDEADKEIHYKAFVDSLEKINKLNAIDSSAVFGINFMADYTKEEMKNLFGLKTKTNKTAIIADKHVSDKTSKSDA